jgi:hypothetical protein
MPEAFDIDPRSQDASGFQSSLAAAEVNLSHSVSFPPVN